MADTYDTHKGLVDEALPTPGVIWELVNVDEAGSQYHRIGRFRTEFAGTAYLYIAQAHDAGGLHFEITNVGQSAMPENLGVNGGEWADVVAAFLVHWEEVCDKVRREKAYGNVGRDILDDAGAVAVVNHDASLRSVTAQAGAQILLPSFDPDVLIYTGVTTQPRLEMAAIRGDGKAVITWGFNDQRSSGLTAVFNLELGDNVITATVTAHDRYTQRVYNFIITKS